MKRLAIFPLILLVSCAIVSNFDQNSFNSATDLKSESIVLISHANEPVATHVEEVSALKTKLSAQLAYEQGKGKKNIISAKQWEILISDNHELLGGFIKDWENGSTFTKAYINEKSQQVGDAYDQIIKLESAKIR